ncbi:MAG: hypothetical protein ACD_49C00035G0006 [uncultured bacterium (gcode 4)]|uniref:Uncharacterized protein n=1 Tax=uncultured bacterium (gcode 4) TaxID=1234023 RepID=K2AXQ4_9BACT|nr:MAG: hypothetical protein ACD_49C00035G0006 [uncultured bacterium (gcode 4)]
MWNLKKIISEIEKRIKNIESHIPKIVDAWEKLIKERVIYYKKEMTIKIKETRITIDSCNKHQEVIELKQKLDILEKEVFLTISKYE